MYSEHVDEQLPESAVGEVPDAIFHYLMPTRYCESDALASAAQQMFGNEAPGTGRDAKDVAFSTFFGAVDMTRMEINVLEHEPRKTASSGKAVVELAAVGSA